MAGTPENWVAHDCKPMDFQALGGVVRGPSLARFQGQVPCSTTARLCQISTIMGGEGVGHEWWRGIGREMANLGLWDP